MRVDDITVLLLMLGIFTFTTADATETQQADSGNELAANPPDAELLEFIAVFEPVDGAWIDPMHFYDSFEANNNAKENDHE
jgi:hypothetical protein